MRNRRALSSMVGAVFFIIAMTIAIGYISFSMDTLDEFAQTVIVKAAVKEDQSNEEFEVSVNFISVTFSAKSPTFVIVTFTLFRT